MREQAAKVQIVINTLELLNIPATHDNVSHLTGIYNLLYQLRDKLSAMKEEAKDERDTKAK